MCLIIFAYNLHSDYKLVLAANRDEFYKRPASTAEWHGGSPKILSGIDHRAGGTWLGMSECGRFAALTNYRNPADMHPHKASRGRLVCDFLSGGQTPENYSSVLSESANQYNGYNLLFGDMKDMCYYSNKTREVVPISSGIFGLSNHLLDTPWPKVLNAKIMFTAMLATSFTHKTMLDMMNNKQKAPDIRLPETGVGIEKERMLSPMFIESPDYGTRCTTVITVDMDNNVEFSERTYHSGKTTEVHHRFSI